MIEELAKYFGAASIGGLVGGLISHLVSRLLDHRLQRAIEDYKRILQQDVEGYKHALNILANRLDFLHQERGKASLALVRLLKVAKMHVKLVVDPMQLGPVDKEVAWKDANAACTDVQNLIAETSFLFPTALEEQMLKTRSALWAVLDEATSYLQTAKEKNRSPYNEPGFRELWKKLRAEFEPLETALIGEIRSLLGAEP